jgi:ubiquinone/menaquinone biosynthesis C-methylase UbiE
MDSLCHYLWLTDFVARGAVTGIGLVIPDTGIAGFKALTLGFAGSMLGASLIYIFGIRPALRPACPRSKPPAVRINQWINRQAAHPRGAFAYLLASIWRRDHRKINEVTLALLEIESGDRVLEIGFGPGEALVAASRQVGSVLGLEVSEAMLQVARRRNRRAIREGRVTLRRIEDGKLGLASASLDRAFCVHTIYFWKRPQETLAQIAEALAPGGRLVLAMQPDSQAIPKRFRDPSYRFYASTEIEAMLVKAGFLSTQTIHRPEVAKDVVWIIADR